MTTTTTCERVQQIDEAKEIITKLEEKKEMRLGGPRGALLRAAEAIDYEQGYNESLGKALAQTAGLAIEAGYDDLAGKAADLASTVGDNSSDDD